MRTLQPQKRQKILQAALNLFAERGFHGTNIPSIATDAGVAAGTIYRYYANKEDLVNAVFIDAKEKLGTVLGQALEKTTDESDPRSIYHQKFQRCWNTVFVFMTENQSLFRFLEMQHHTPYLNQQSQQVELQVLLPLYELLAQAHEEGIARNSTPAEMLAMVWGALVGLIKYAGLGYYELRPESISESSEMCWHMLANKSYK